MAALMVAGCIEVLGPVVAAHVEKTELVGKNLVEFNKYGDYPTKGKVAVA
jgi:hypothetical protein